MNNSNPTKFQSQFAADIFRGLTSYPKRIPSKYFYDRKGDALFQEIMHLPEYYLTGLEYHILKDNCDEIGEAFNSLRGFDLIELGAGDGKKTKVLLRHFKENNFDFKYLPVDISHNALELLSTSLQEEIQGIEVDPQQGTYAQVLDKLADYRDRKKVIMFLGSNIGNLSQQEAVSFLKKIAGAMTAEDLFFIGIDQKKDPQIILDAYNDASGVTAAFNKNLLTRINRELNADFKPDQFSHWPTYDPETGTAQSFLVSTKEQMVQINDLELEITFGQWESIHTEISQKYDDTSVAWLAREAGLEIDISFSDSENYFKNYIFKKKNQ